MPKSGTAEGQAHKSWSKLSCSHPASGTVSLFSMEPLARLSCLDLMEDGFRSFNDEIETTDMKSWEIMLSVATMRTSAKAASVRILLH